MKRCVVWTLGSDRPGIAAAITGPLLDLGGNLEDCSMTILSGQFAMVLVVQLPDEVEVGALEAALAEPTARLDLGLAVRPIGDLVPTPAPGPHCVVSVYGADHPGIVHRFVTLLADAQVNITDLATRVIGDSDDPVYAMVLEVVLPADLAVESLREQLATLATEVGVDATMRTADADVF